jgi:hypothetical protein
MPWPGMVPRLHATQGTGAMMRGGTIGVHGSTATVASGEIRRALRLGLHSQWAIRITSRHQEGKERVLCSGSPKGGGGGLAAVRHQCGGTPVRKGWVQRLRELLIGAGIPRDLCTEMGRL